MAVPHAQDKPLGAQELPCWTQGCAGDRLRLPAGLVPGEVMSPDRAWPPGDGPAQVPEPRAGCGAPSALPGETRGSASPCAGSWVSLGTSQRTLRVGAEHGAW